MANAGGGCPHCGCRHDSTTKTFEKEIKWQGKKLPRTKRYRRCRNCGLSHSTIEMREDEVEGLIQEVEDLKYEIEQLKSSNSGSIQLP